MCTFRFMLLVLFVVVFVSWTTAQDVANAVFELAPIASATAESSSFALVANRLCDAEVITKIYQLYARNTMVFQTCVSEGKYKIFPFSGKHPTTQQIGDMARSLACRAVFTSLCFADIPQCEMSNFPLRATAETLLKIGVDMDKFPNSEAAIPSTERFIQMSHWRRDVNLAEAAGRPSDSQSKLYAEYSSNLHTITTNGLVRLTADKVVQYRLTTDGSFSQDQIMSLPDVPGLRGSGSYSDIDVYAADATVKPSNGVLNQLTSNESTDATEFKKTSTSESTNAAAKADPDRHQCAALAAIVAMLVIA